MIIASARETELPDSLERGRADSTHENETATRKRRLHAGSYAIIPYKTGS
jgi:hypothetical protein